MANGGELNEKAGTAQSVEDKSTRRGGLDLSSADAKSGGGLMSLMKQKTSLFIKTAIKKGIKNKQMEKNLRLQESSDSEDDISAQLLQR